MPSAQSASLVIPDETKQKYPDLIKLILASESMNDEERQYWINILPVMTPDQVGSLRDILETEKRQLAEIDKKYAKEIETVGKDKLVKKTDEKRKKRREETLTKEKAEQSKEMEKAEKLLEDL